MDTDASNLEAIAQELLALPRSSRAFLAERLIESIDDDASPEIEDAWGEEISRRIAEYGGCRVKAVPAEDVFAEARERLNEARRVSSRGLGGVGQIS